MFSLRRRRDRSLQLLGVLAYRAECRSCCGWFVVRSIPRFPFWVYRSAKCGGCRRSVNSNFGFPLTIQSKALGLGGKASLRKPSNLFDHPFLGNKAGGDCKSWPRNDRRHFGSLATSLFTDGCGEWPSALPKRARAFVCRRPSCSLR